MAMAHDLGLDLCGRISSDASAALGIIQRQGLGKLRHIATQFLWIQEKVRNDELDIVKVPGEQNPADLFTKNVPAELIRRHTGRLGIILGSGRAVGAPQLSAVQGRLDCARSHERHHDDAQGTWEIRGDSIVRTHDRPRRELFTPLRVNGAPPAEALASMRVTTGRFVRSGRTFRHTDTWTHRTNAHRALEDYWVGTTEFYLVSVRAPSCSAPSNTHDCREDEQQYTHQYHDNDNHQNDQHNNNIASTQPATAERRGDDSNESPAHDVRLSAAGRRRSSRGTPRPTKYGLARSRPARDSNTGC